VDFDYAGSTNSFGDNQLQADLHADEVIFTRLRATPQVASASSEEQTDIIPMNPGGEFSVSVVAWGT
jgi:fructose-1,6-bisphosphatase